jgi:glycopeptide antibiotics resistance protein
VSGVTTSTARRALLVVFVGYLAALAVILLVPSGQAPSSAASSLADLAGRLGAPAWTTEPSRFEFLLNAVVIMPVSGIGLLLWPRSTWQDWTAYAFVLAGGVEFAQGLLLPERTAAFVDVVANTLGGLGGAVAVTVARRLLQRRSAA